MTYRRVQVTWLDTREEPFTWGEVSKIEPEIAVVHQVGFLVKNENGITALATAVSTDSSCEEVGGVTYIPNGCITLVEDI